MIFTRYSLLIVFAIFSLLTFAQTKESDSLFAQGVSFYNEEKYEYAIFCFDKCDSIDEISIEETNERYGYAQFWLGCCYYKLGDITRAKEYTPYYKFTPIDRRQTVTTDSILNLGSYFRKKKDYHAAIREYLKAYKLEKDGLLANTVYTANTLSVLAQLYYDLRDFKNAAKFQEQTINLKDELGFNHNSDYVTSLNNLTYFCTKSGDTSKSIYYGEKCISILDSLQIHDKSYAIVLSNLATSYAELGDLFTALEKERQALDIKGKVLGTNSLSYILSKNNIATYLADAQIYDKAIKEEIPVLSFLKKDSRLKEQYATSLSNISVWYANVDSFEIAIKLALEAKSIRIALHGEKSYDVFNSMRNLSSIFLKKGLLNEANNLCLNALKIQEGIEGKYNWNYLTTLYELARISVAQKDTLLLKQYAMNYVTILKDYIQEQFLTLSSQDRYILWDKISPSIKEIQEWCTIFSPQLSISAFYLAELSRIVFSYTEKNIIKAVIKEHGTLSSSLYKEILYTRMNISKAIQYHKHQDIDSLENNIKILEMKLLNSSLFCKTECDINPVEYNLILSCLGEKDVVIEFLNNPIGNYLALVIRKNYDCPHIVQIGSAFQSSKFTNIWNVLEKELVNTNNIYFSPCGELYTRPIENLPYFDGKSLMSDHFNLYRISSARELIKSDDIKNGMHAAIYGGMKYNISIEKMTHDTMRYRGLEMLQDDIPYNPYIDTLSTRKDNMKNMVIPYLPDTKIEADTITMTINMAVIPGFKAIEYCDTAATETSFKALSGKKPKVIHVATHGFYYTEDETEKYKKYVPTFEVDERYAHRYVEDKQLTRSGLYFSGADNLRQGKTIPEGVDDGILTAQEISLMDLRGCDLVVLSACQTGQGDIGSDGVFGLQRGFKKAGVNSILMTLDKVDDLATRLLMTEFYKNYTQGKSKHESLRLAQKYLREYKDKNNNLIYKDPKIWGSFILLDALD